MLDVTKAAILDAPEKKENLAAAMGKDRAQMYRQAQAGKLTVEDLAALGPEFAVRLAHATLDAFSPLDTPHARLRHIRREQRRLDAELDQLLEHIA